MDFELSHEQKDIQKAAREFAQGEFEPDLALSLDQKREFPETLWKKACQLGFVGLHYPEEFGGQGLGLFETLLVMEAFCRVDSGIGCALSMTDLGSEVISAFGSVEQKKQFLPALAKGKKRMTVAFAESEDGKDFSSISTTAERNGGYLLRGKKRFVPNAVLAELFLVLAKGSMGEWLTLIVEKGSENLHVSPVEKMGVRMVSAGALRLDEVKVPDHFRLGQEGDGIAHVNHAHRALALRTSAQALGIMEGALDRTLQYAKQRVQFGKSLSQFQAIQHKLADMAVGVETARWFTYKAATEYDQEKVDPVFLSMTQMEVGRRMARVVDEAMQIHGGYGYIAETAVEHYFRDAWTLANDLGTEEELKDEIAERILGSSSVK